MIPSQSKRTDLGSKRTDFASNKIDFTASNVEAEAEVEMGRTARRRNMRVVVESGSEDDGDATPALNHRPASD
jgi:hypothetical protein